MNYFLSACQIKPYYFSISARVWDLIYKSRSLAKWNYPLSRVVGSFCFVSFRFAFIFVLGRIGRWPDHQLTIVASPLLYLNENMISLNFISALDRLDSPASVREEKPCLPPCSGANYPALFKSLTRIYGVSLKFSKSLIPTSYDAWGHKREAKIERNHRLTLLTPILRHTLCRLYTGAWRA